MNILPKYLKYTILLCLDISNINNMSLTSKYWHNLISNEFWKYKIQLEFPHQPLPWSDSNFKQIYYGLNDRERLESYFKFNSNKDEIFNFSVDIIPDELPSPMRLSSNLNKRLENIISVLGYDGIYLGRYKFRLDSNKLLIYL